MASFTDQLIPFNPYVSQLPVDDYVRVGMAKQLQYNEGVRKVQSYIDSVAGIEVIKPEQKDYLQKRIMQLQGEVSKIVQRDFSNQQLVNSVGILTSKIANDPIIQGAEQSTRRYKAGMAKMKEAQAKGNSSPSNEWFFQRQVEQWMGDGDVASVFSGDFTPYTDVNKKVLGVIKELDPNSTLEDIPYKRGPGGNILLGKDGLPEIDFAMMEKSTKGVSPERIQAAIRASLDQNDLRQLSIDGAYSYRDVDKVGMKTIADESYTYQLNQINDAIKGLLVDRQTNVGDANHINQVDARIAALRDAATQLQNNYRRDIQSIDTNLEGYKSNLYMQNWLTRFGNGFAYAQNALTYKENPFFMAAERRRENDIKYQEFLVNKQFEAARIALDERRVAVEEAKLDIERTKAEAELRKKGVGTGDAPLTLTGAAIREAIDQKQLAQISGERFIEETKMMEETIDSQKMALLAQIRPDLVHVVRDPNGLNPRYEYNVAGKDPNTVINEAEATILKLKESYDKGEEVPDGVKTYFDNLSTTDRRVQNRKVAIDKITRQADEIHNIRDLESRVPPLQLTLPDGSARTVSPAEQLNFERKLVTISGTRNRQDRQNLINALTPAERLMYDAYEKAIKRLPGITPDPTEQERRIVQSIRHVSNVASAGNAAGRSEARRTYIDNATRAITGADEPTSFIIESFKNEDQGQAQAVAINLLNSIVKEGKENPNPYYDEDAVAAMLNRQNANNTSYSLVGYGGDRYAIRLSNSSVTSKPVEVDITKQQAQDLFGANQFLDNFQAIREALQLTRSTGRVTTDVPGTGRESAFTLRNNALQKYGVMYHVEDPLKNGGLQARLYIYDKSTKQWIEKTANFGQLLTESQITKFLSMVNDQYIDALLQKK